MARILIIDDDEQFLRMLMQIFERNGYEVLGASDGEDGIALFRKKNADLIITDIIMPGKEGLETIAELKRDFPDVKIIAISGGGRLRPDDYLNIAVGFGASRTFTKPIDRKELLAAVEELLG